MAFSFENLKANLSNVAKKTGEVAEKAVKKGGEVAELAKLNISLKDKENELKKLFTELGMLTYDKAEAAAIAAKIVDIDDTKAAIELLKSDIASASGKKVCECGKEIDIDASFCPFCGARVETPAPKTETVEAVEIVEENTETVEEKTESSTAEAPKSGSDSFVDTFENVVDKYDL